MKSSAVAIEGLQVGLMTDASPRVELLQLLLKSDFWCWCPVHSTSNQKLDHLGHELLLGVETPVGGAVAAVVVKRVGPTAADPELLSFQDAGVQDTQRNKD